MGPGRRDRTPAAEVGDHLGEAVRLCGFAEDVDAAAEPVVVALGDQSGRARLLCGRDGPAGQRAEQIRPGSAIEVVGTVCAGDAGVQVRVDELHVPGPARADAPVDEASPLQQRLDWRHVDLRRPRNRLIFEVQTTAERAMREFWAEHGFLEVHSPKLRHVPNKAGDLFWVEYFDRSAYLVQSPQFYKQMAMAAGFDRVFEIGPAFRAEPTVSGRHATEFTSVDVEMAWIDSDDDLMAFEEGLLCRVLGAVQAEHGDRIARWFDTEVRVPSRPFPRVRLEEAQAIVAGSSGETDDGDDLDAEAERRLAQHVAAESGHEFVFVTHYPEPTRPFFHMRWEDEWPATRSFDLLWKGLEITSGAQREHRYDQLVAQAKAREVPFELIAHFLEFFKHGCPPHGGFGLGLTRMLMCLLGVSDMREVSYLFRGRDRLCP